jgi:hypothetical protein
LADANRELELGQLQVLEVADASADTGTRPVEKRLKHKIY